jgi:hypothetical protein
MSSPERVSRRDRVAAVALVGVVVVLLALPWLRAWLAPPPGRSFAGAFFYQDDHLQYLSFVEQAARGEWLFVNKFDPQPQRPFLLNAGWWAAGRVALLLRAPVALAWFAWGLVAAALLVLGVRRILALNGRAGAARDWGTILVLLGGGLGWVRLAAGTPWPQVADLTFGFYPWLQMNAGAHGTLGTALLVWALALHVEWRRDGAPKWRWVAVASVMGLCRPFDLATFVLVAALASFFDGGCRGRAAAAADLAWLTPVLFYDGLAFGLHPSFASWSGGQNVVPLPGPAALLWALGPALLLGALALAKGRIDRTLRATVGVWILVAAALLVSGLGFASQFAASLGTALLLAVALGAPGRWLPPLALALSPTALVLTWRIFNPAPEWFPPRDYLAAAQRLAASCAPGDVVLAPSDPSLFVAAFSPCHTAFGHRVLTPRFAQRAAESEVFYAEATSARWRGNYLAILGARYVMVPPRRDHWLPGTGFVPRWRFAQFEVWERQSRSEPSTPAPPPVSGWPAGTVVAVVNGETGDPVQACHCRRSCRSRRTHHEPFGPLIGAGDRRNR